MPIVPEYPKDEDNWLEKLSKAGAASDDRKKSHELIAQGLKMLGIGPDANLPKMVQEFVSKFNPKLADPVGEMVRSGVKGKRNATFNQRFPKKDEELKTDPEQEFYESKR